MAIKITAASPRAVVLPDEKSVPSVALGDYTWLIYGEMKIGKTSLAAEFEDALFCFFEPGGNGLEIFSVPCPSWATFKEVLKQLKETDRFKTVVIDTVDLSYAACLDYVGNVQGFEHPADMNDFGKSWQMVSKEFSSTINELVSTGRGVLFISHAKEVEFQPERGLKYNKIIPAMSNQARTFITGFVDMIAYYGYYGTERRLVIRGSDKVDAGHRMAGHFRVIDGEESQHVYSIPMGESAAEGYANILRAFNNEQDDPYEMDAELALSVGAKKNKR